MGCGGGDELILRFLQRPKLKCLHKLVDKSILVPSRDVHPSSMCWLVAVKKELGND